MIGFEDEALWKPERKEAMCFRSKRAFTLIELLIVVAIIAILAAIAIPNFLEAQIRARVSRAKADMRTIAVGLEAYMVDYNVYPFGYFNVSYMWTVTTPVAYLTNLPSDPFLPRQESMWHPYAPQFFYVSSRPSGFDWLPNGPGLGTTTNTWDALWRDFQINILILPFGAGSPNRNIACPAMYQMRTLGPNRVGDYSEPYDATNGTMSGGDISLFGPGNPGIF